MRILLAVSALFMPVPSFAQTQEDVIAYLYTGCLVEKYCAPYIQTDLDGEILALKAALVGATGLTCEVIGVGDKVKADISIAREVSQAIVAEGEATCLSEVE